MQRYSQPQPIFSAKEPYIFTIESCISAQEPYILTTEPSFSAHQLCIKKTSLSANRAHYLAKETDPQWALYLYKRSQYFRKRPLHLCNRALYFVHMDDKQRFLRKRPRSGQNSPLSAKNAMLKTTLCETALELGQRALGLRTEGLCFRNDVRERALNLAQRALCLCNRAISLSLLLSFSLPLSFYLSFSLSFYVYICTCTCIYTHLYGNCGMWRVTTHDTVGGTCASFYPSIHLYLTSSKARLPNAKP